MYGAAPAWGCGPVQVGEPGEAKAWLMPPPAALSRSNRISVRGPRRRRCRVSRRAMWHARAAGADCWVPSRRREGGVPLVDRVDLARQPPRRG